MRRTILALLASAFTITGLSAAEAAVVRFHVELDSSSLYFDELFGSDGSYLTQSDPEQSDIAATIHPLSGIVGSTGYSILEIQALSPAEIAATPSSDYTHSLSCLSGFLCGLDGGALFSGYGEYESVLGSGSVSSFRFQHGSERNPTATSWSMDFLGGTGSLSTFHDGDIAGGDTHDGTFYTWWAPGSTIAFDNVRIVPNPLPASVFLVGAGVVPLAMLRRRKTRV